MSIKNDLSNYIFIHTLKKKVSVYNLKKTRVRRCFYWPSIYSFLNVTKLTEQGEMFGKAVYSVRLIHQIILNKSNNTQKLLDYLCFLFIYFLKKNLRSIFLFVWEKAWVGGKGRENLKQTQGWAHSPTWDLISWPWEWTRAKTKGGLLRYPVCFYYMFTRQHLTKL